MQYQDLRTAQRLAYIREREYDKDFLKSLPFQAVVICLFLCGAIGLLVINFPF